MSFATLDIGLKSNEQVIIDTFNHIFVDISGQMLLLLIQCECLSISSIGNVQKMIENHWPAIF